MSSSTGPSELNRSYYTGNSLTVSTSVHPLVSTQQISDTTPSCSALGSQSLHGHIGSPVLAGPTRNVTGEAMPTSLAEALTQLSFLEFVQRCNLFIAPSQPTQLPAPISFLDVAVQTAAPCEVSQDASTQTSNQPVSSLSLDVAVQTSFHSVHTSPLNAAVQTLPHSTFLRTSLRRWVLAQLPRFLLIRLCRLLYAVWCNMMLLHNLSSRSSSLAAFIRTVLWTAKTMFVSLRHQCRIHMVYLSHRLDLNSQSLPLSLLLIRTCSPMLAALPAIPSSRLSAPHRWEHTLYAQPPAPRGVQVPRSREPTTLSAPIFVQMQASSPNQRQ